VSCAVSLRMHSKKGLTGGSYRRGDHLIIVIDPLLLNEQAELVPTNMFVPELDIKIQFYQCPRISIWQCSSLRETNET